MQGVFVNGKIEEIHFQKIQLTNQAIIAFIKVKGTVNVSVNGTIYLAGFPQYNDKTKEIFFDQLDYALETKNKLMRTANWLAQGLILKKIEQSCRYSIKPNLEEGKKSMMTYLKNYSPMQGVFVNGKIEEVQFQKIQLTNQAIIAFIKIKGTVNVSVNGLK